MRDLAEDGDAGLRGLAELAHPDVFDPCCEHFVRSHFLEHPDAVREHLQRRSQRALAVDVVRHP
eukprot:CAMPEP_0195022176 /NCGR_PEP_ID=MMETSP0326_2-20130528/39775_1 /TAXON_ID=2866 ORGANISM="Crypthecodinium cohnii, Strain Seligo" /NCGR_SAMPLE_ID=MMETSP0326_2 /ASSEMBLY_ACC=CAM_ASM_000348 /LENGTH=63 /DNA_ID=CAMNT_0040041775 /DNA_START=381 /DNA_END=569 /DNA_ORIENTATION=-